MADVLADVDGCVGRDERAQHLLIDRAWDESSGHRERMAWREIGVKARQRAEPVDLLQLGLRAARDVNRLVVVLRRLLQVQPAADDRSSDFDVGLPDGYSGDVDDGKALQPERGLEIAEAEVPFVAGAF